MTWADVLGCEARQHHNLALQGSGNLQIFIRLIEAMHAHAIGPRDTVVIMWTATAREDRTSGPAQDVLTNNWISVGNIYNQKEYPREWVQRYADGEWYLRRDLSLISAAVSVLRSRGVDIQMTSMLPLGQSEDLYDHHAMPEYLAQVHAGVLDLMRPSMLETVFNGDWATKQPRPHSPWSPEGDPHPTPQEHLEFVQATWPDWRLSQRTLRCVQIAQSQLEW